MPNFDPLLKDKLLGVPYVGTGTTLELTSLQTLIKNLISENKYSVRYIINLCVSYGYSRKMANDVFTQLTGLSPKLIVENNEYYKNPVFIPSGTIAWGLAKNKKDEGYYVVPFEYGYVVNKKNQTEVPEVVAEFTDINSAANKLKTLVSKVFTIDQIITENLLKDEPIQLNSIDPLDINQPSFSDPIRVLKNRYKKRFITDNEVKAEVFKLVASEQITEKEGIELSEWVNLQEEKRKQDEEDALLTDDIEFGSQKKDPKGIGQEEAQEMGVVKGSEDESVEGWSNYETWNVALMINNNQELYNGLLEYIASNEEMNYKDLVNYLGLQNKKTLDDISYLDPKLNIEELNNWLEQEKIENDSNYREVKAANFDIENLKEESEKTDIEKAEEDIDELDIDSLLNEETPESYFEEEIKNDKINNINERVANIIDEFTKKFEDLDNYNIGLRSYKIQFLSDDKILLDETTEDLELNAKALVMIILNINPKEDTANNKKALAIFSINDEKTYWPGTIKADNGKFYAFSEEGLDTLFRELDTKEEIVEDITGTSI